MKKITTLFLIALFIVSAFGIQNTSAADNFDWDNIRAEYTYNSSRDDLEIKIFLPNISRSPDERYELEVEIDNRDYDKRMSYSSSRDELYAIFDFEDINSSELEDYLDLDITIEDQEGDKVFDGRIEMSSNSSMENNSDRFEWSNLDVSYTYNESSEKLSIILELDDVNKTPRFRYTAMLESNNRDYKKTMSYSSSRDELKTTFTINNVDEDDLEDYLDVELEIEDNSDNTVYEKDIELENTTSNSNSNNDDEYNWKDLEYSIVYEKDRNRLNVRLELENIDRAGNSADYDVVITIDGKRYTLKMFYSNNNKNLYTYQYIPVFTESRVMPAYNVGVQIKDDDRDTVYSTTKRVVTNKNGNTNTNSGISTNTGTNTNSSNTNNTLTNSQIEVTAYRYIYRVEQRFSNPVARAAYLNRTIRALESSKYSQNPVVVDGIIKVLRNRILSYTTTSTSTSTQNSNNMNTGNIYVPTPSRPNKAESIKSDGHGGTFKYVGGYNY